MQLLSGLKLSQLVAHQISTDWTPIHLKRDTTIPSSVSHFVCFFSVANDFAAAKRIKLNLLKSSYSCFFY